MSVNIHVPRWRLFMATTWLIVAISFWLQFESPKFMPTPAIPWVALGFAILCHLARRLNERFPRFVEYMGGVALEVRFSGIIIFLGMAMCAAASSVAMLWAVTLSVIGFSVTVVGAVARGYWRI